MDKLDLLVRGLQEVPNPKYKPGSKRSKEPATILQPLSKGMNDIAVNVAVKGGMDQYSIDAEESKKYREYGLDWQPGKDMDAALANAQSNWSKFFNAVGQTLYSEIFLGTLKATSDLVSGIGHAGAILADDILQHAFDVKGDVVQNSLGMQENDFSNPISKKLEEWQEYYKNEVAPIYTTPGVDISNGGLSDFGWWMSNMPSIASSITLLLPARAATIGIGKIAGAIGKARRASKVEKAIQNAEKYKTLAEAGKVTQAAKTEKELNAFQRFWYNPMQQERIKTAGKIGSDAILMRTIENYQEAHQTYTEMYKDAAEYLDSMTPFEYEDFINKNKEDFEANDIDLNDRDAVAKRIAKRSADRTFLLDYSNTIFDVIQLYGLRNIGRIPNKVKSPGVLNAQEQSIQSIKQAGKQSVKTATGNATKDTVKEGTKKVVEDVAKNTKKDFIKSVGTKVKNFATGTGKLIASEATEGIEEAVNYVAQQEGLTLGNTLLGKETDATLNGFWNKRLTDYLENAELWESAFWGVAGGVVFGAAGSGINKLQFNREALSRKKKREKNEETEEEISAPSFITLRDAPDVARAKAAIAKRNTHFNDLITALSEVAEGRDPRMARGEDDKFPEIIGDETTVNIQKERIRNELIAKYQNDIALDAINSGTFDLLVDYFRSEPVKQAMVDNGIIESNEVNSFVEQTVQDLEDVRDMYNNELAHVNYQVTALNSTNRASNQIPLEYVQQIAKSNVERRLKIKSIDREINRLNNEANKEEAFSELNEADKLEAKRAIRLAQLTELYARLEADKKEVQNDKRLNEWRRAESIADIETQQEGLIKSIKETYSELGVYDSNNKLLTGTDTATHQMGAVLNAIRRAQRQVRLSDGSYVQNTDPNLIVKTDEEIIKEYEDYFKDNTQDVTTISQLSKVINDELIDNLSSDDSVYKKNTKLFELYQNISNLETTRGIYNRGINRTQNQIANQVDVLHNRFNKLRSELIFNAEETIRALHDKYKDTNEADIEEVVIKAFFNDKNEAERIAREKLTGTDENGKKDSEKLIDALKILNFSQGANRQAFQFISTILRKNAEKHRKDRENSSTSENGVSASQNQSLNNNSQQPQNAGTSQENNENEQPTPKTIIANDKKVGISLNEDGSIKSITRRDRGINIIEYSDGSIELNLSNQQRPTQRRYIFSDLFETPNGTILEDNTNWQITSNPILSLNEDGNTYTVEQKGDVTIINNQTGTEVGTDEPVASSEPVEDNPIAPVIDPAELTYSGEENASNSSTGDATEQEPTTPTRTPEQKELIVQQTLQLYVDFTQAIDFDKVKQQAIEYLTTNNDGSFTSEEIPQLVDKVVNELQEAYSFLQDNEDPLTAAAANLTYQSRYDEFDEVGFNYNTAFTKAIEAFVEEYSKLSLVPEVDGKKTVRIRDILRVCNNLNPTHDTTIATQIHGIIHSYLTSPEGREKYIVLDEEDSANGKVIEDCVKTTEELTKEPEAQQYLPQDVNIYPFVKAAQDLNNKHYKDALNSLRIGDKLRMVNVGRELIFYKGDVAIGNMPLPRLTDGGYVMYNSGWRTDVRKGTNGEIVSDMRDIVLNMFTSNDVDCKHIRELLIKAGLKNIDNVPDSIIDEFSKIPLIEQYTRDSIAEYNNHGTPLFFVEKDYADDVSSAPRTKQVVGLHVNHRNVFSQLLSLWNYTFSTLNENSLAGNQTMLEINTNQWFDKLYTEYDLRSNQNKDTDVEISYISDGKVIEISDNRTPFSKKYEKAPLVKNASNNLQNIRIAIVNPNRDGEIFVSNPSAFPNGKSVDNRSGFSRGTIKIAVFGRNKNFTYVDAYPVKTNDRTVNGDRRNPGESDTYIYARAAMDALHTALVDYNNSEAKSQELFDRIEDILRSLFYTKTTKDRIPLFIQKNNGDKFFIHPIQMKDSRIKGISLDYYDKSKDKKYNLNIWSHDKFGPKFGVSTSENGLITASKDFNRQMAVIKTIEDTVSNWLMDYTQVNISDKGIRTDSIHEDINKGFIKRQIIDGKSKIIVDIDTGRESSTVYAEYDSYNDFIIDNNLIKVNLGMNQDGEHFDNRSDDILQNQVLRVDMPTNSSPVERSDANESLTTEQAIEQNHIDYVLPTTDERLLENIKRAVVLENDKNYTISQTTRLMLVHSKGSKFVNDVQMLAQTLGLTLDDIVPKRLHYYEDYNWYGTDKTGRLVEKGPFASAVVTNRATVKKYVNGEPVSRTITGQKVICGPRLLNMLASKNEYSKNRAFRILMHERLHQQLHADGVDTNYVLSQLKPIYDTFVSTLDSRTKEAKKHPLFKQGYRYDVNTRQIIDKNNVVQTVSQEDFEALKNIAKLQNIRNLLRNLKDEQRLEEFVVEAMTNLTVIEFMNSIEVEDVENNTKETLFSKILKFISKLFGVEIKDKSLTQKYLNALANLNLTNTTDEIIDVTAEAPEYVEDIDEPTNTAPVQTSTTEETDDANSQTTTTEIEDNTVSLEGKVDIDGVTIDLGEIDALTGLEDVTDLDTDINTDIDLDSFESNFEEFGDGQTLQVPNMDFIKRNMSLATQSNFDKLVNNAVIEYKCH